MEDRYARNAGVLDEADQEALRRKTAAVVGLGGLGGHIAEQLARLGVGRLILADGDTVAVSNLNRQIFATEETLGWRKTDAAQDRLRRVNGQTECVVFSEYLTGENSARLLAGADIALDAADTARARLTLERCCAELGLPLVHGAVGGFLGEVCFISPGDGTLAKLYANAADLDAACADGCPAFMPAAAASIQVAEAVKYLLGRPGLLRRRLLRFNLLTHEYETLAV